MHTHEKAINASKKLLNEKLNGCRASRQGVNALGTGIILITKQSTGYMRVWTGIKSLVKWLMLLTQNGKIYRERR